MSTTPMALRKIRGVSLLEALVAMALMAIGLLGVVGVQSTMRSSSDISKQRSEAVRIAQEAIEQWRSFHSIEANATAVDWGDLVSDASATSIAGTNATYSRTRTVTDLPAPARGKALTVLVSWNDRNGTQQQISVSTVITGIAPELFGTMGFPTKPVQPVLGRKNSIPLQAKDLGDGTSGLLPPNAPTGVVWLFNNNTGVFRICATTATVLADLLPNTISGCTGSYLAITGYVRYSLSATQPANSAALQPTSTPAELSGYPPNPIQVSVVENPVTGSSFCYPMEDTIGPEAYSAYFCGVPASVNNTTRTVRLSFGPSNLIAGPTAPEDRDASRIRICRYFDLAGNGTYSSPGSSLANQNYLVIRAGDGPVTPPATATRFNCPDTATTVEHPLP